MQNAFLPKPNTPWFREPWPWLVMLGPALVIVAGIATSVVAFRGADGLVAEDYYKQGLMINRVLERERRAQALQVQGSIWYSAATRQARVHVTAAGALPPTLMLRVAHPTRAGMDRTVVLRSTQAGIYGGTLELPSANHWLVTIEGGDWRVAADWDGQSALHLGGTAEAGKK